MEVLRILIVEDDLLLAAELEEQLLEFGYAVTETVSRSDTALHSFRRRRPDLVLCDIRLKGSALDGIELVKEMNKISRVPIVFLTASGDTATVERAKLARPAYYLVKPCNAPQLKVALDFAIANFSSSTLADPSHSLRKQEPPTEQLFSVTDYVFLKDGYKHLRVKIASIIWVMALGANVKIITEKDTYVLTANLTSFSQQVPKDFMVRIHRSYIINIQHLASYQGGRLFMKYQQGEQELPIGKTYRSKVKDLFPRLKSD